MFYFSLKCYSEDIDKEALLFGTPTGFFIINVTFKQVIKRTKRIVYTLILCSTCCKLSRVYAGNKSLKIRHVSFPYGCGMSAPSKRVICHFWMMTPCDGIDCSRVRCSTESDISSTKVCSLFLHQKV